MIKTFILIILSALSLINSQSNDYCKSYDIILDLNLNFIKGDWYPLYTSTNVANIFDCYQFKINVETVENKNNLDIDYINLIDNSTNKIKFLPTKHTNSFKPSESQNFALLTIVDTDYNSYMSVIICHTLDQGKVYQAIILGRTTSISDDIVSRIKQIFVNKFSNFDWMPLRAGDQCKY